LLSLKPVPLFQALLFALAVFAAFRAYAHTSPNHRVEAELSDETWIILLALLITALGAVGAVQLYLYMRQRMARVEAAKVGGGRGGEHQWRDSSVRPSSEADIIHMSSFTNGALSSSAHSPHTSFGSPEPLEVARGGSSSHREGVKTGPTNNYFIVVPASLPSERPPPYYSGGGGHSSTAIP